MAQEVLKKEIQAFRKVNYPIDPLIHNRWSPRSMSGEEFDEATLMGLFEAARFAPSSYNNQPWRFIYAKRNSPEWQAIFDLLIPFNQSWCKNAAVLVVVISKNVFEHNGKPARTHSFDTGSAWMSLALEATSRNLVAHGMEGFDFEKARKVLEIPDDHTVEAMFALGHPAPKEALDPELQKREQPSDRRPLEEILYHGKFRKR